MRSMRRTELLGTAFGMTQMEVIYKLRKTRCYFGVFCSIWIIFGIPMVCIPMVGSIPGVYREYTIPGAYREHTRSLLGAYWEVVVRFAS